MLNISSIYIIKVEKSERRAHFVHNSMKQPSFLMRFIVIFIPLIIFMVLVRVAGIDNLFMIIILALAFVWMIQAIYKKYLQKKYPQEEEEEKK